MAIEYVQGDLLQGKFSLRLNDACVPNKQNEYPIPAGAKIEMRFPGTSSTVVIDSDTSLAAEFGGGDEIVIDDYDNGECSFSLNPTKGALVKLSTTNSKGVLLSQPIDIIVYNSLGSRLKTFKIAEGIFCTLRGNA